MLFNSYSFLVFFPIVVIIYYLLPKKVSYLWLLAASYYFYMGWNAKYALLLLLSTTITYISGILLQWMMDRHPDNVAAKKWIVAGSFASNLAILFFFKYFNFTVESLNAVLQHTSLPAVNRSLDVLLPVGISFYTFQALGYTVDVYRGEIRAERNFFRYALFVSFFPQLVAGPIERSKNLLNQLRTPQKFDYRRMCDGLLLMIWGYFLKLVIADRISIFVDNVYANVGIYDGKYLLLASVLFAFQIYCDFAGYSTIAIGAAEVMGYQLMENFNSPYLSQSVSEFWRRWHISLSSWFKDYLYIPLGGNRKGKVRKYINIMIVFLVSGLWHGANWSYVVWGGLNGLYQVIGAIFTPVREKMKKTIRVKKNALPLMVLYMAITFVFVDFAWIFFRADTMQHAFGVIGSILHMNDPQLLANGTLYDFGLSKPNFVVLGVALVILLFADICKYRGIVVRRKILESNIVIRWTVTITAILGILVFGIWGSGYSATNFIYFQF